MWKSTDQPCDIPGKDEQRQRKEPRAADLSLYYNANGHSNLETKNPMETGQDYGKSLRFCERLPAWIVFIDFALR